MPQWLDEVPIYLRLINQSEPPSVHDLTNSSVGAAPQLLLLLPLELPSQLTQEQEHTHTHTVKLYTHASTKEEKPISFAEWYSSLATTSATSFHQPSRLQLFSFTQVIFIHRRLASRTQPSLHTRATRPTNPCTRTKLANQLLGVLACSQFVSLIHSNVRRLGLHLSFTWLASIHNDATPTHATNAHTHARTEHTRADLERTKIRIILTSSTAWAPCISTGGTTRSRE